MTIYFVYKNNIWLVMNVLKFDYKKESFWNSLDFLEVSWFDYDS